MCQSDPSRPGRAAGALDAKGPSIQRPHPNPRPNPNKGFLDAKGPSIQHDASISSVSLDQSAPRHLRAVKKGELDLDSLQQWIGEFLNEKGEDIYRVKGVLAIAHAEERFVIHGVHMLIEAEYGEPWGKHEARESKLVFIGKGLDRAALVQGFNACIAGPELNRAKIERLRFKLHDPVECNMGGDYWVRGQVVQLLYRDELMAQGKVAPYQIELENGELIWAPSDHECVIRAAAMAAA